MNTDKQTAETAVVIEASTPRRGRKPLPGAAPMDMGNLVVMQEAAASVVEEVRQNSVTLHRGELAQSLALAQRLGSIKAFQLNESVNRVAMLRQFAEIREGKTYKGLSILDEGGQARTISSWAEFCEAHGYSKSKIEEDLQNLAVFGGSLLEAQEALGLGYRDLRMLRAGIKALPPEEQQKVLDEVQAVEGSEEAKALLGDLRTRLASAEVALTTAKADMAAKETVSRSKSEKIDTLNEQLAKLTSLSVDERQSLKATKNLEARKELDTACHQVVGVLNKVLNVASAMLKDADMDKSTHMFAHARVALMCDLMAEAILNVGLDVDFSTRFTLDYGPEGDPAMHERDNSPEILDAE